MSLQCFMVCYPAAEEVDVEDDINSDAFRVEMSPRDMSKTRPVQSKPPRKAKRFADCPDVEDDINSNAIRGDIYIIPERMVYRPSDFGRTRTR